MFSGPPANTLEINISDGISLAVPATLRSLTAYVLLEQEHWFEKEIVFLREWLHSGMTAIDIGANLGVYSLPMARFLKGSGKVFAYEPASEPRSLLAQSRELNGAMNLQILPSALSDTEREGRLELGSSSELNKLSGNGTGETVRITSLDREDAVQGWSSPDFVKIDAEGEEERIITGGPNFFARHSPLVMFEVNAGGRVNERLRRLFPSLGYQVFRQLGAAPILIPDDPEQPLDSYELNLFAAKPDRVRTLSERQLLVERVPDWAPTDADHKTAAAFMITDTCASLANLSEGPTMDPDYRNSLTAYAVWRSIDQPVERRCAALAFAFQTLKKITASLSTPGPLSTFSRVAWEWGARCESVRTLQQLLELLQSGQTQVHGQFWPASARFENISTVTEPSIWFCGAAAEQFENTYSFSSLFSGLGPVLPWLSRQSFAVTEMERRRVLIAALRAERPRVPSRLCTPASDHLNASLWAAGAVPGTVGA